MAGMFSVNHCPVTVLFDSGASHTFISQACITRLNLHVFQMKRPYIIRAPGAHLSTSQLVRGVPLDLSGTIFQTTPIVLPSQGIDVILGMNWMKEHDAIINTSPCFIQLNSPTYGSMDIHLSQREIPTTVIYHIEGKILEVIPVVCETPMCYRRTCQACLPIGILSLSLSYSPAQCPNLEDHTE